MSAAARANGKAVAAFLAGWLSLACGLLALRPASDPFLLGVVLFWALALLLGLRSRAEIKRARGRLRGRALAGWGMGLPAGGLVLGGLLLPAT
jgi:hypothetical protein